ncbi:MAG: RNA polymerase sigma factor [Nocardioides sp.]
MGRSGRIDKAEEFQWLFVAEYPAVVRTTYLVLHDPDRAEEIAQDAFVQLLRHWDKVRDYDSPQAWVRRVAIRLAVRDTRRERTRVRLTRGEAVLTSAEAPGTGLDPDLLAAIGSLPTQQRCVVVLFYYEDRPMEEVAEIVGCSTATGWVHLHKARKRLGVLLSEEVSSDVD